MAKRANNSCDGWGARGLSRLVWPPSLLAVIGHMEPGTSYWYLGAALLLTGFGIGTAFVPATHAVTAAVPETKAGLGSAINDAGRRIGAALGSHPRCLTNAAYATEVSRPAARIGPEVVAASRSVTSALQLAAAQG